MADQAFTAAELERLTETLSGSVDARGFGRTFIGPKVAEALAERLLAAGYVPPSRFYIASDEALAKASKRGAKNAIQEAINRLVELSERMDR